ncbi:hypothetical protein [Stieleria varia]|uniref:Uncharacterized protein n=1 Tax=Stieleria varia TaxID=2528005 RepID=A0A5C6ANL4_9BACT|nr:hypothetical protein [Stieleria varia]TWU01011.1 hypothetical protein Pla52n_43820 [Stieleria varia]
MRLVTSFIAVIGLASVSLAQSASTGERELERIIKDRPAMDGILPRDDVIVRWVVRRLATGSNGETVKWDPTEPDLGMAQHVPSRRNAPAMVRITSSPDMSGQDKWYLLVFELHNLMHPAIAEGFERAARLPNVGQAEFVNALLDYEYERMARTNKFFIRYPIPSATKENAPFYFHALESRMELFKRSARDAMISRQSDTEYGKNVVDLYSAWYRQIRASPRSSGIRRAEQWDAHEGRESGQSVWPESFARPR